MANSFPAFYHGMSVCCAVISVGLGCHNSGMLVKCWFLHNKKKSMEAQYALRIPHDLLDQLRTIAKAQDLTIAQLFRKLARDCVKEANKDG